jgi:S-adenosylmethionine uptake transporter
MLSPNLVGALAMMLAMALFTMSDAVIKTMAGQVPLSQIIALRNVITTAAMLGLAWRAGVLFRGMDRRDFRLALIRAVAEVAAAYFFLTALFNMPLANITAVLLSTALVVTFAAALFLGENVGWRRVLAIAAGFVGVLLIVRPGPDGFNLYAGYTLIAVLFIALRDIVTRRLSAEAPTLLVTAMTSAAVGLFFGLGAVTDDWVALDWHSGGMIVTAGAMVLVAYLASVKSMRAGDVGFIAPFRYTALLWGLVLGWIFFDEWPSGLTLLGAGIVVASGLYSFYREMRLRRRADRQKAN